MLIFYVQKNATTTNIVEIMKTLYFFATNYTKHILNNRKFTESNILNMTSKG